MRVPSPLVLVAALLPLLLAAAPPGRRLGEAKPLEITAEREVYGAFPSLSTTTSLATLLHDPERFAGRPVRLEGVVGAVCQRRGCWLTLRDAGQQVQVRFRDYRFFVPLDVAGRPAVIEGTATVEVTSEAMRKHLAEDAGRPAAEIDAIVGDERTVLVVADAVEIRTGTGSTTR